MGVGVPLDHADSVAPFTELAIKDSSGKKRPFVKFIRAVPLVTLSRLDSKMCQRGNINCVGIVFSLALFRFFHSDRAIVFLLLARAFVLF